MSNNPFTSHISPQHSNMSNNPFINQQTHQGAGAQSARSSFDSIDLAKENHQPYAAMPQQAHVMGTSDFSAAQMEQDVNEHMRAWQDPEALNNVQAFDRIQEPNERRAKRKNLMLYLIVGAIVAGVGVLAVVGAVILSKKDHGGEVSHEGASANVTSTETVTQTSYVGLSASSSSSRSVTTVTQTPQAALRPSTATTTLTFSSSSQSSSISTTVVTSRSTNEIVVTASPSSSSEGTTTVIEISTSWSWTTVEGSPLSTASSTLISTTSTATTASTSEDHCTTDVCVTPVPASTSTTSSFTAATTSVQDRSVAADLVLSGYTTFTSEGLTMIEPIVVTASSQTVTSEITTTQTQPTTTTVSLTSSTTSSSPIATAKGGLITFCGPVGNECQEKRDEVPLPLTPLSNSAAPAVFNGTEQSGNMTDSIAGYANGTIVVAPVYNVTNSTSLFSKLGNDTDVVYAMELREGNVTDVVVEYRNGSVRGDLTEGWKRRGGVRRR